MLDTIKKLEEKTNDKVLYKFRYEQPINNLGYALKTKKGKSYFLCDKTNLITNLQE